jgi:mRNA interferase MazF
MNPSDVILVLMPGAVPGASKLRPALFLAPLPGPYQTVLVCGISTRLGSLVSSWDEVIQPSDADFASSGLHRLSIIRLSYLHALRGSEVQGIIGAISSARLARLRSRISDHLRP